MDLSYLHVPKEFNSNTFWYEISGNYRYDTSNEGTVIQNPGIHVGQSLLACVLFDMEDSLNVSRLLELYFLCSMLEGDWSFLVNQLYSAATTSAHRIVIRDLNTSIAKFVGAQSILNDRLEGSERFNLVAFEQIKFCKVDGRRICWIYRGNRLTPLPNVDCTCLLNLANLYFFSGDEE